MSTYKIKNKTIVDPSMMNNFLNGRGVDFCLLAFGLNAKNHFAAVEDDLARWLS